MFEIKTKWIKYFRRLRLECILANCTTLSVRKYSSINEKENSAQRRIKNGKEQKQQCIRFIDNIKEP